MWFVIGVFVGVVFGYAIAALCFMAREGDVEVEAYEEALRRGK